MRFSSHYPRIEKRRGDTTSVPGFDYEKELSSFSFEEASRSLSGLPHAGGLNIAYEAVERHAAKTPNHVALRFLKEQGPSHDVTCGELSRQSNRFASMLRTLEILPGDTVFTCLGRVPELFIAALGTWKHQAIFCPLFSAFGQKPIQARMELGRARVLVTTSSIYEKKIKPWKSALPSLTHILLIGDAQSDAREGIFSLASLLNQADDTYAIEATPPETPAILHFTSGTTGTPKGAVHVHQAVLSHHVTARWALDFQPDDLFWCTADPGWVTGTSYGIIAPLSHGLTTLVDEAEFDASRWYQTLETQKVNVWYTSPTAIRMLMKAGPALAQGHDFSALRFIASVGEPLNPEAVFFGMEAFGRPIHDNYWQTETGGIMISNYASMDIKPGSMGRPLPGIEAAIVQRVSDTRLKLLPPNEVGQLAFKAGWPSMFRGYWKDEARYQKCFVEGYYLTGDDALQDEEGYFYFVGREDDVIKSSGHLIGPFEVESALLEHPAVAEAAAIGVPAPLIGEAVKCFISLKNSFTASEALRAEILGFARKRLGAALAPRDVVFMDNLPRTRSGKLMRRLLRARELGLPEGDLSTLEQPV